jgi:phospholipase C
VSFTISFNNYAPHAKPQKVRVAGHSSEQWLLDACNDSDGWYDLTITLSTDAGWSQRLTGHLESGRPSVTG